MLPIPEKLGCFYIKESGMQNPKINPAFITRVSEAEYESHSKFFIPSWFKNKKNFDAICSGNYFNIMPMTAEVIPSLTCPFKCYQCSYKPQKREIGIWGDAELQDANSILMDIEIMDIVIDRLHKSGMQNLVITGGGEPLSNAKVSLFGLDKAKNLDIATCLYTNGYLLSSKD